MKEISSYMSVASITSSASSLNISLNYDHYFKYGWLRAGEVLLTLVPVIPPHMSPALVLVQVPAKPFLRTPQFLEHNCLELLFIFSLLWMLYSTMTAASSKESPINADVWIFLRGYSIGSYILAALSRSTIFLGLSPELWWVTSMLLCSALLILRL